MLMPWAQIACAPAAICCGVSVEVLQFVIRRFLMTVVTLRRQGNSVGVSFPTETRVRMGFEVGQDLTLIELADGVKLVKRNVALERQLALAREVLREQADVLQELAKR